MSKGRKVFKNAMNDYFNCNTAKSTPYSTSFEHKIPALNLDENTIKRLY